MDTIAPEEQAEAST